MSAWRFYQGVRGEWRWYRLGAAGDIHAASDQAFAELEACMANARYAGFDDQDFQVYTRHRQKAAHWGRTAQEREGETFRA